MARVLTAIKVLTKDFFCIYRTSVVRFLFQLAFLLNFVFLLPLLMLPKDFVLKLYYAFVRSLSLMGIHSLHGLVFFASPVLSALLFLYLFYSSDSINLTHREFFLAIHPISLTEILFSRAVFQAIMFLLFLSSYVIIFYIGTYIAGYSFSFVLAYIVLIVTMITFQLLVETGKLANFKPLWLLLSALSVFDFFRKTLTVSYVVYIPLVSVLNCYTNLNIFPAFAEFFAVAGVFYFVSKRASPDLEVVSVEKRTERTERSLKEITPLSKSLIEFERVFFRYVAVLILASVILVAFFGREIAGLDGFNARILLLYAIFFLSSLVEGLSAQEASLLWFYRVACREKDYVIASLVKGEIAIVSLMLPVAIVAYPAMGMQSFGILALSTIVPPYYTFVSTYLASKTKMKVTRLLRTKRELEDVRLILMLLELPVIVILSIVVFLLPAFAFAFALVPLLSIPLLERCARSVEVT